MSVYLAAQLFGANIVASQEALSWTVQQVLYSCESAGTATSYEDVFETGSCLGLVRGVGQMLAYNCSSLENGYHPLFIAEAPHSLGAAVQAFTNWARANPDAWGEDATDGIILALMQAFPCTKD